MERTFLFLCFMALDGADLSRALHFGGMSTRTAWPLLFLWAASIVYLVGLPMAFDTEEVSNQAALVLGGSSLILGVLAALMFFYQAIPFRELKGATGWLTIAGSVLLAFLGFSIFLGLLTG